MDTLPTEQIAEPQRRQLPAGVANARAARSLVAMVQDKLGPWQAEAVKLEVMIQRLKAAGRRDPPVGEAVRTLLAVVTMQMQVFETTVADAPSAIRSHSRVTDTQKVLVGLTTRLDKMLGELGETPAYAQVEAAMKPETK